MSNWIQRLLDRVTAEPSGEDPRIARLEEEKGRTHQAVMRTLAFRLESHLARRELTAERAPGAGATFICTLRRAAT